MAIRNVYLSQQMETQITSDSSSLTKAQALVTDAATVRKIHIYLLVNGKVVSIAMQLIKCIIRMVINRLYSHYFINL